jgi:ABC-type sugar transport system substrate-binding protein
MDLSRTRFSFVLFGLALAAASVVGQQSKPAPSGSTPSGTSGGRHIACWKQVGISPAVMQQHRAIMEAAKSKVQTVCKDESLTPDQKKEQIHQIHQEAAQQSEGLIPPAQNEALKKCQTEQAAANPNEPHPAPARKTGPCGEPLEPDNEKPAQPN